VTAPRSRSEFEADALYLAGRALTEDGTHDVTSDVVLAAGLSAAASVEFRDGGVFAGRLYADAVARYSGVADLSWSVTDGEEVPPGTVVAHILGDLAGILRAERPLLNFLQRSSGIATETRRYVKAVEGTDCRILHTRKTPPGLRRLDAAAVLAGGGSLHRLDLEHAVMIKDNHWQALAMRGRSLQETLSAAADSGADALYVEVETSEQVELACEAGATRLLIDNQPPETLQAWGTLARRLLPTIEIEASGGINLDNVRAYAEANCDFVSVGALTHSVKAADLALEVERA
jgi:nicotinate-nucleotide pyrophosphorylase (carboxylating)